MTLLTLLTIYCRLDLFTSARSGIYFNEQCYPQKIICHHIETATCLHNVK